MSDDLNSTTPRTDAPGEAWPDGDLPELGGRRDTLMPGTDIFQMPTDFSRLWDEVDLKYNRPGHPDDQKVIKRLRLKFTRDFPLIVVGGPRDGMPLVCQFTTQPVPRGRKDDPKTAWVSWLAYVLEIGLSDRSRPKTPEALKAAISQYAGKTIRLEHGLSAHCREDKVRWIEVEVPGTTTTQTLLDPQGTKGCGKRFYTRDFKGEDGNFGDSIQCDCGAILRGFEQVERVLPPVGQAVATQKV
jgi:hypothetical protein